MSESSKYSITNNQSNVSIENQGNNPQVINVSAENISLALQELKSNIDNIGDETRKDLAEAHFEALNAYIESKNKEKATGVFGKLRKILGDTSSIITIGTFLSTL